MAILVLAALPAMAIAQDRTTGLTAAVYPYMQLKPQDIDVVHPGMKARVRLSAFNARRTPPVEAAVLTVSADQLVDEKTGEGYFRADLKIPPQELAKLPKGDKLSPGMPAEAMIVTGRRSILSYVVSPLTDTIRDALRED